MRVYLYPRISGGTESTFRHGKKSLDLAFASGLVYSLMPVEWKGFVVHFIVLQIVGTRGTVAAVMVVAVAWLGWGGNSEDDGGMMWWRES